MGAALAHDEQDAERRDPRERRGDQERQLEPGGAFAGPRQEAAQAGAKDETDVVGGAQHRHAPGTVFHRRHVGDVSLHHRAVAAGHTAQEPHQTSHEDVRRERERQVAEAVGADRRDEQRLAADTVREPAPEGLAKEGAGGVGGEQEPDLPAGRVERAGVEGQQRHDDAEAQHVNHHHHEQGGERRARRAQRRFIGRDGGHVNDVSCTGAAGKKGLCAAMSYRPDRVAFPEDRYRAATARRASRPTSAPGS